MTKEALNLNDLRDSKLLYNKKLPPYSYIIILFTLALLGAIVYWSTITNKEYIVKATGVVESIDKNYIMSPFQGEIVNINVQDGSYVEKNDILLTISSIDFELQRIQIEGRIELLEKRILQLERLEQSIIDNTNYFSEVLQDDKIYYYQYEVYQSKISQCLIDPTAYKEYGYSDAQVEAEIVKNESKIAEIYYESLRTVNGTISELISEIENLNLQGSAISTGTDEYRIVASTSGIVHLASPFKEGMVIQAGSTIGTIIQENDMYHIIATTGANEMPRIHVGDRVDISVVGLAQTVFGTVAGTLDRIDRDISTSSDGKNQFFGMSITPHNTRLISSHGEIFTFSNGTIVEMRIIYDEITYFEYFLESLGLITRGG